jgi:hypothetical protein
LQEGRDGPRRVNLHYPVKIADIDAEFECAGCDDDAIGGARKRIFGTPSLGGGEGTMGYEGFDAALAQQGFQRVRDYHRRRDVSRPGKDVTGR